MILISRVVEERYDRSYAGPDAALHAQWKAYLAQRHLRQRHSPPQVCNRYSTTCWPELTNWPSGTHKGTKLEQPGSAFEAEQAVTPFLTSWRLRRRVTANT